MLWPRRLVASNVDHWTILAQFMWTGNRTVSATKRLLVANGALRRMTPVKNITITCHYSVLLFHHNDDGKTHNVLNRFLGLKS